MQFTPSELQAFNNVYYEISALQLELQLLRMQRLLKANFNPNQPRVPRGQREGGQWTRIGGGTGTDEPSARVSTDDTSDSEPSPRSGIETTTLPGNRRIVRDRSGTEPWEAYFETLRPSGAAAERFVVNRDGSAIRSQYSTTPELTGWDESHTIIGAGGETLTCQNLGKTQTIFDATGEVIQIASWTSRGPEIELLRPDLGFDGPDGLIGGAVALGLMLPLFSWFASTAQPNRAAVYALRARDYVNAGDEKRVVPLFVGEIDAAEVSAACPAIELVQRLANKAAADAQTDRTYRSAREYGTAVHFLLKTRIDTMVANGETNLAAEVSYLKSEYADREIVYGERDSIRIDVFDNTAQDGTVCVYDIKTGDKGLDDRRAAEIMRAVFTRWPKTKRIVVIEVRPTTQRPKFKGLGWGHL